MNYQSSRQDSHNFKSNHWKIQSTNEVLNQLQKKMYSHFNYDNKKSQEQQLINSSSENTFHQPPLQVLISNKNKNTFKLYAKNTNSNNPITLANLQEQSKKDGSIGDRLKSKTVLIQTNKKNRSQAMQLIEQVDAIQILVRKKLKLKQQKISSIQREIMNQTQQKIHLFKLNCKLEQQLQQLSKNEKQSKNTQKQVEQTLKIQLKRLKKQHHNLQAQNKSLKKEQELLRQSLKQAQNGRKDYIQCQIKASSSHSNTKQKIMMKRTNQQEVYLRGLVVQLDKLKKMVKSKMKKSKSGLKLRINNNSN